MCGIFGFNFPDKQLGISMRKILHHRGPDDNDVFVDDNFTLGYTRLSIIDLKTGNQPIFNEDQTLMLYFNGEIYNFQELKKKLQKKGHRFNTKTDSEVIVHSYEEYGKDFLNHLNGMFAFVLYDTGKKELFIARDRLGIKPLFYYSNKNKFIFASEIKAILEHKIKREINLEAFNNYFTYRYCLGEKTIFNHIHKLLPGHYLIYKQGKIVIKKYWRLEFSQGNHNLNYYKKKFLNLLEKSVKYRIISDVPIGALLSGGIDSSSIVAMISRNSEESIRTYTIGFDEGVKNEFDSARMIADKFNTNHHEYIIDSSYIKYLPKTIRHLDEPLADPTAIPNYILSEKASKKVKVLINGDGADEFFGGYEQYKMMLMHKYYHKLPLLVKNLIAKTINILPEEPFFYKLQSYGNSGSLSEAYTELISVFGRKERELLFTNSIKQIDSTTIISKYFGETKEFLNKMLYTDIHTYLPDNMLMKYDRITMAKSVEGRVPFCDHHLAEFSASLPVKFKINHMTEKYIIRKAMENILPKEIIRRKKQRFLVPTDNWMKKEFKEFSENVLDENRDIVRKFFNKDYINKFYNNKLLSKKILNVNPLTRLYYSRQLWTVTNYILWYKIYIKDKD